MHRDRANEALLRCTRRGSPGRRGFISTPGVASVVGQGACGNLWAHNLAGLLLFTAEPSYEFLQIGPVVFAGFSQNSVTSVGP